MKLKGVIFLIIASIAYSGFLIFNKLALNGGFDAFQYSLMMITILVIFSIPFFWKDRKKFKKMSKKEWLYVGLVGVIAAGIVQFMFVFGQKYTNATNAGFISTLSAPFTAIFAMFMIKERLNAKKWFLGLIGFIGIIVLSTNLQFGSLSIGDLLIISAMVLIAFSNVLAKMAMTHLSGLFVNALRNLFGYLFVAGAALFMGRFYQLSGIAPILWLYLLLSAILTFTFLAFFYWGMEHTSPTIASVIILSMAIFTAIFAIIFLGESLSIVQWIGGLIGMVAIGWFALTKN